MTATSLLQPGQLEPAAGEIPELRLPPARLFADRARRFRQLATGHRLAGYLLFLARLAEWQHTELHRHPEIPVPDPGLLVHCREHAMPPLAPAGWPPRPCWREAVRRAAEVVLPETPPKGRQTLAALRKADHAWLETQAEALLRGKMALLDLAAAPLIGAALQVQWTSLARRLQPNQVARPEHPVLCPVCGSHPVASVIDAAGATRGLRWLHCALCGSAWHVVRATCSQCGNTRDIGYYGLEGTHAAVRAEACPACCGYLKILLPERDADVDPVADDIATLTLDLLLGEEQRYTKTGINFFMMQRTTP